MVGINQQDSIDQFISRLSERRNSSTVFNPYRNPSLCENLKIYLLYIVNQGRYEVKGLNKKPVKMLIGEAPGYKGARLTGIPFSSGALIRQKEHRIFQIIDRKIILEQVISENSASLVWAALNDSEIYPLFWNAFPFHPFPKGSKNKNRAPIKKEVQEGASYLKELIEIFCPTTMAGVGRKGVAALENIFPDEEVVYIRHPSYGGKKDFEAGMKKLLASD